MNFIRLRLNLQYKLLFVKELDETTPNYLNNLEDKIVELSLKLKAKENELNTHKMGELLLLKNFTHNLKNPIGNIMSFSDMILMSGEKISSEKQHKYLDIIQNASNFSMSLINTFSEYFILKNSNEILEKSTINVHQIILDEVDILKSWASERDITVEIKKTKESIYLNTNEKGIRKIVTNLIHNAIRFSKDNSRIFIELTQDEDTIEIKIIDQGIGISEVNLSKIFNEFFVCNTYDLYKIKCIGLGLSTSKTLTESLNGKLKVKSELNKGTLVLLNFENK